MILQRLDSILDVSVYPDSIRKALEYLRDTDFSLLEDGEYEIEGRSIFARVFTLESKEKEESHAEYHEKYIDIQYWLSGRELMGWKERKDEPYRLYSGSDDLFLIENPLEGERFISCRKGDYMILFPSDIHRPGIRDGEIVKYRKVVVKVDVSTL